MNGKNVDIPQALIDDDDHQETISLPPGMRSLPRSSAPQFTLYRLVRHLQPAVILEIGSQYGASAVAMALAQRDAGLKPQVISIDPFFPTGDNAGWDTLRRWHDNVYPCGLKPSIQLLITTSAAILPVLNRPFDFAFVDGSHRYEDVREDLLLTLHGLREGGHLVVHDYAYYESVRRAAKEVFAEFAIPFAENLVQTNGRGDRCGWAIARKPYGADIPARPLQREIAAPPPHRPPFRLGLLVPETIKKPLRRLLRRPLPAAPEP